MEFIDHNGHIFSLPSYKTYPVGYEYDEQPYIFWLNDTKKLSTDNYYIKPIRFIINEDDYDLTNTTLSIKIESSYYKLMGSYHLNNLLNKSKNLFDYLTISSDMLYWEEGNYDSITNENKPGYIKFDLLKDTLTEDDITSVQHLTGEYGDIYTMVTFYVVGYSDNENVMLTNILINLTEDKKEEYCVITVGGEFITENESLIINGKNMGVDLPKDIVRAVYQSSFYNYNIDNELYNSKLKELLLNYMSIKGECGNYNSALSAFKWFGWGNKITINKLIQTDNEFINQYIIDSFSISNDMLYSYKNFKNTTYIKLNIFGTIESDEYNELKWDDENDFWGEGNPKIHEIVKDNEKVVYEESDMIFYKQYYDYCFEELGLKLSALEYYYKKYFLPIHIFIHSASISYQCFMNPNKLIIGENKTLYSEKPILIGDVFHNNDTSNMLSNSNISFIDKHQIMYYTQTHFIDKNFNEFNRYLLTPEDYIIFWNSKEISNAFWNKYLMSYDLFWVNENCLSIPMRFTQKCPRILDDNTACEYYECKLLLEKIDKSIYNYLYTFTFSIEYDEAFSLNFIDGTKNPYNNIKISHKLYEYHDDDRLLHKTDIWSDYMFFNEFKTYIKTKYFDYLIFGSELPQLELKIESINELTALFIDNIDYLNLMNISIIDGVHNIIYETSFNFIQYLNKVDGEWKYNESTLYKNFVIIPKILGSEYNINFWLNNEFNIYINVNGHWFNYNFNCILPELQMNIGKLEYKYFVDIEDSYRNQFGDVSFFKQLNKLTNNTVVFNKFMWQPELVQVNNIDFFNNLLDYYKRYYYNITYTNDLENNIYNLDYLYYDEKNASEIQLNDLYYVFYINNQQFYINKQLIKQYFIDENNKSLKIPLKMLSEENQKNNWILVYNDNELNYIPIYNENNDNDSNNSYINYEGSSSIFNSTIYDNKNGFIGENKENYVIQSEDGKTLIFNTIYSDQLDSYIHNSDIDNDDNFIIIMETDEYDENTNYINIFFEFKENNSINLYIYDINYNKINLKLYSSIYKNELELYNKYKEFPNIINNSKYLNKVHLYDIYKNGVLFTRDNNNLPELYNIFFNQDEQISNKIDIPNTENIYDLYIMKTPYKDTYQWYSLFISKLTNNKYNPQLLDINDYQKEFTLNNYVDKLTYIEKQNTTENLYNYGYRKINDEIINNVILENGLLLSDLYIVFNTTIKVNLSDNNNMFEYYLCEYLINSIYNINLGINDNTNDIGLYWNNEYHDTIYGGIHWTSIPLNNVYCPYCGKINTLYYIGNDSSDANIKQYKCANSVCDAYIGETDKNGVYTGINAGPEIVSIEDASTVYWNNTLRYSIPYKLIYTLEGDTYSELYNPKGRYHKKETYIPERYSFSLNNTTKYIYSYYNNDGTYSYLINNNLDNKVDIFREYNYINFDDVTYSFDRETYTLNNIYSDISESYYNIDFISGLNNNFYTYYSYINDITIYYKDIYDYNNSNNNYMNFYLLYDKNILYNDSWELVINKSTSSTNESDIINIYKQSNGEKLDWVINDNFVFNNFNPKLNNGNYIYTQYNELTENDYYIELPKKDNNYLINDIYIKIPTSNNEYVYVYINNSNIGSDSLIPLNKIDDEYNIYIKDYEGKFSKANLCDLIDKINNEIDSTINTNVYIEINSKKLNLGTVSSIVNNIITENSVKPNYYIKEEVIYTINKDFISFDDNGKPINEKIYLDTYQNLFILTRTKNNNEYIWDKIYIYKLYISTPVNIDTVGSKYTLYSVNTKQYYPTDYIELNEDNKIIRKVVHDNGEEGNKLWYLVDNDVYENNKNNPIKWKTYYTTEVLVFINDVINIEDKHWYYTINGIEYEYKGSLKNINIIGNNYININLEKQGEQPILVKLNYLDAINSNEEYYDKIDYYTFKYVKSSDKFLINRMDFIPTNGKNHFNNNDIIVTNISTKMDKNTRFNLEFKFDYGSKWTITPVSLKTNASDTVESTTEMGIISIGNNKIKYDSGYYDIICKYSIDSNTQNLYSLKSRILVK